MPTLSPTSNNASTSEDTGTPSNASTFSSQTPSPRQTERSKGLFQHEGFWILLLIAVVFLAYGLGLNAYPLLDVDEPRYAQSIREMAQMGQWLIPYFNGDLRLDKPPLFYWLQGLASFLVGDSFLSARLPSALASAGSVGLMWLSARQLGGLTPSQSFLAAGLGACCVETIALARFSTPDALLAFCLLGVFYAFGHLALKHHQKAWLLAALFSGLGALTKGPVAFGLPGAILLAHTAWSGHWKPVFASRYFPMALGLWASIALPWFFLGGQALGNTFWDALFFHNVTRFQDVVSGHQQPWFFYSLVVLVGFMPWTPLMPLVIGWLRSQKTGWRRLVQTTPASNESREESQQRQLGLWALLWSVGVFGFYSLAKSQLLTYILPVFYPLGLVTAISLIAWGPRVDTLKAKPSFRGYQNFYGLFVGLLVVIGAIFWLKPTLLMPDLVQHLAIAPLHGQLLLLSVLGGMLPFMRLFSTGHQKAAFQWKILVTAAVTPLFIYLWMPSIAEAINGDLRAFTKTIGKAPVAFYGTFRPSMVYWLNRRVGNLSNPQQLETFLKQHPQEAYIIVKKRHQQEKSHVMSLSQGNPTLLQGQHNYDLIRLSQHSEGKKQ
jgi:4-amino-4-deoxy-L-arabinose transferase-like glycosyltransferase